MAELPAIDDFSDAAREKPLGLPTPEEITANLAPLTSQAAGQVITPVVTERTPTEAETFQAENVRPGVPLRTRASEQPGYPGLDVAMGRIPTGTVNPMFRFQMERRTGLESQLKYAKSKLGDENARMSKDGKEIIVTVPNPEQPGEQMDVTVNDRDMTLGDFAALAAHIPEFAGAIAGLAAARMGRPEGAKGFLNFLKDAVGAAVGQETVGGAAEVVTKLQDLEVVNPGEITQRRALQVPIDVGLDLAMGGPAAGVVRGAKLIQSPFSGTRTELQQKGVAAAARIKDTLGIDAPLSPGQVTGSPMLIFGEKYVGSTTSGAKVMLEAAREQQAKQAAIMDAISSGGGTEEEVGRKLIARLQAERDVTEQALQSSKQALESSAESAIKRDVGPVSGQTPVQAGESLRSEIISKHGSVMAERQRLYTEAYAVPGAQDPIIPTAGITGAIQKIKLPMRTVQKEIPDVDAYGNPIARTKTAREPVREFLHPEVEQFLGTKLDPKMPLNEVVQMRDLLWDEINRGEAVKGIPTRQLSQIGRSMTEAIDKGIADLPAGSELKAKLSKANEFYKKEVLKFEEAGIADIFKDIKDPGYRESSQILERLTRDPEKYLRTVKLLGATSPGAKTIRAFIRDDLLRRSAYDFDPTRLEASRFISNLRKFREDFPDIYKDVIGPRGDSLLENATLMGTAQGSIALKDAQQALTGKQSIVELQNMVRKQWAADVAELDQLIKNYTVGKLDVNTIHPEKMVRTFFDTGTASDLRKLMDGMRADSPALAKQVERKMTERLLADAGGPKITDVSIKKLLDDPNNAKKYEAVLGAHQLRLIRDLADYLGPIRYAEDVSRGSASFVKASKIGKLFTALTDMTKPTKEIGEFVKFKVASLVFTSSSIRSWVLNTPSEMNIDLAKAIVLSQPFVKALGEDVADDGKLASVVSAIRQMLTFGKTPTAPPAANDNRIPADQF